MNTRKLFALPLAALAVGTLVTFAGGPAAHASESDTCDKSFITVTKTDANTGAPLAGAVYTATTSGDVYLLAGDAQSQEVAFKNAFNHYIEQMVAGAPFSSTAAGTAINAATQETLGTTPEQLPPDVTDPVSDSTRVAWQQDPNGDVAALKADVDRRLAAVTTAKNSYQTGIDAAFDNNVTSVFNQLTALKAALNTATTTTDNSAFATAVHYITDPSNFVYGLSVTPSKQLQDTEVFQAGNITQAQAFSEANAYAAQQIGAVQSADVTTDANGVAHFTMFSVNNAYYDAGTRGDLTCSQLQASVKEKTAPTGYQLNTETLNATSLQNETGSVSAVDLPNGSVTPPPPVRASTGLKG